MRQDLEDTISIVESSPQKFQLSEEEVQARRDFIESTRQRINGMRDEVQGQAQAEASAGYSTKKCAALPEGARSAGRGVWEEAALRCPGEGAPDTGCGRGGCGGRKPPGRLDGCGELRHIIAGYAHAITCAHIFVI